MINPKFDLAERETRKQLMFPFLYGKKLSPEAIQKCEDFINKYKLDEKKND